MITTIIGFIGLGFGLLVAPPQIIKILKTKNATNISKHTYIFLCITIICYFIHALAIKDLVFSLSNGINLLVNGFVLSLIYKYGN